MVASATLGEQADLREICFVHVPKTAGQSLRRLLDIDLDPTPLVMEFNHSTHRYKSRPVKLTYIGHRSAEHMTIAKYKASINRQCFAFAFVRNPYDRLASTFAYLSRGGTNAFDKADAERYFDRYQGDFKAFVMDLEGANAAALSQVHLRPQAEWLCENDRIVVDFLGRYERFERDLVALASKLEVTWPKPERINVSEHAAFEIMYDRDMKDVVARVYARDFALFGYDDGASRSQRARRLMVAWARRQLDAHPRFKRIVKRAVLRAVGGRRGT